MENRGVTVEEVREGENVEKVGKKDNLEMNVEEVGEGEIVMGEVDVEVRHESGSSGSTSSSDDDLNVNKYFVAPSSSDGNDMEDVDFDWEFDDSNGDYELSEEDFVASQANVPPESDDIPPVDEVLRCREVLSPPILIPSTTLLLS